MRWDGPPLEARRERRERRALSALKGSVREYEERSVSSCARGLLCERPPPGFVLRLLADLLAEPRALGRGREGRV